jgi:hypothetical protein
LQQRVWLALASDLLADALHAPWQNLTGETRTTLDLPSEPRQPARLMRRLCLLQADGIEAFEPWTSEAPMLEPFLRGLER